jgi:polyhydroxyalkanoate synthesis regulator phasin
MADERSTWKRLFDTVEQAVAPRLEELAQSEQFSDAAAVMARLRADFAARTERTMRQNLHFWNLPAGSDIKRLSEQIASLERRVRDLSKRLDELVEPNADGSRSQRSQQQRSRQSNPA